MKSNTLLFSALALLLAFTACQEDEETHNPDLSALLADRNWRLTSYSASAANGEAIDLYAVLRPCDRDDTWRFADNAYYEKDENLVLCDTLKGPIYETGTWRFADNALNLTRTGTTSARIYTIQELTPTALRLQNVEQNAETTVTYNLSFTNE